MIKNKRILALIPARGGSKGIKDKNIIPLNNKPLISYTIEAAKGSKYIDKVVLSTDSEKIAKCAEAFGADVPFLRPTEFAQDHSKTIDAVLHAVDYFAEISEVYNILVLLQPTQPLRTASDIDQALELFIENGTEGLVSVSEVFDSPLLIRQMNNDGLLQNLLNLKSSVRRQDMPIYYRVNGCIYINWIETLNSSTSFNDNILPYIMPKERSVDIDEMSDLAIAEYFIQKAISIKK